MTESHADHQGVGHRRCAVRTLLITVAIVVVIAVIFVFLRKFWRATVIPGCDVAGVVDRHLWRHGVAAGISLDNLSLMALTVAAGFVVDDAIVMIENIVRLHGGKASPAGAAQR